MSNHFFANLTLSACSLLLIATPVFAATAIPASKCVTTKTKATNASVTAQMEKDIAAYAKTASAATAIQTYRQNMAVAWDAMKEPYCGFGAYGTASAIKSYSKSVTRVRAAFLTQVKGKPATAVAAITKISPAAAVIKAPVTRVITTTSLRGLHRGMQTSAVLQLQQLLNRHLGSKADASMLTGFFGPKTEKILIQFQIEKKLITNGMSPGAGMVGPKTTAALGKI